MRIKLLILLISGLCLKGIANPNDTIYTTYKNGSFITVCKVIVYASDSSCNTVARDFDYQMKYKLEKLFPWALKGMNLRMEKKELMMFNFKSTTYDNKTKILRGVGDAVVPNLITIPDIIVDSRISNKKYSTGRTCVELEVIEAKGFLKQSTNIFSIVPVQSNRCWFILESRSKFGWFFDFFITQSRFSNIMEWRLNKFVHNLKEEAEKRETKH